MCVCMRVLCKFLRNHFNVQCLYTRLYVCMHTWCMCIICLYVLCKGWVCMCECSVYVWVCTYMYIFVCIRYVIGTFELSAHCASCAALSDKTSFRPQYHPVNKPFSDTHESPDTSINSSSVDNIGRIYRKHLTWWRDAARRQAQPKREKESRIQRFEVVPSLTILIDQPKKYNLPSVLLIDHQTEIHNLMSFHLPQTSLLCNFLPDPFQTQGSQLPPTSHHHHPTHTHTHQTGLKNWPV